jgi:hypothetical protein
MRDTARKRAGFRRNLADRNKDRLQYRIVRPGSMHDNKIRTIVRVSFTTKECIIIKEFFLGLC